MPNGNEAGQPSTSEIDEWAERERKRRESWLSGPTESEKALWAERERERRVIESRAQRFRLSLGDPTRTMQQRARELQLATEGAVNLLFHLSISDAFDKLMQAGREWEDEFNSEPPRRRRVAVEAEPKEQPPSPTTARVPTPPEGQSRSG
jgi:hypothetical protein